MVVGQFLEKVNSGLDPFAFKRLGVRGSEPSHKVIGDGVKRFSDAFDTDTDRDGSLVAAVTKNGHDPQVGTESLNVAAQG